MLGGVATCPSAMREQVLAHKMHLWFVTKEENKLIFSRKQKPYPEYINDFFDKLLASKNAYLWTNFQEHFMDKFFVEHIWKDRLIYKINNNKVRTTYKIEGETEYTQGDASILNSIRAKIIIFTSKMIRYFYAKGISPNKILCCPYCKGELLFLKKTVRCDKCKIEYKHKEKRIFYFEDEKKYE